MRFMYADKTKLMLTSIVFFFFKFNQRQKEDNESIKAVGCGVHEDTGGLGGWGVHWDTGGPWGCGVHGEQLLLSWCWSGVCDGVSLLLCLVLASSCSPT